MLSPGRLIVTLHPPGTLCAALPPGHSALSNTPPELLLMLNVNRVLGQRQMPPLHELVWQSAPELHVLPKEQSAHTPPQSTSLSFWFFTPSPQFGVVHVPPLQMLLVQSLPALQLEPGGQSAQTPPQSVSLSFWFWTPSLQVGA